MTALTHEPKQATKVRKSVADIRLITFDLDNTLWDVDQVIIRAETKMRQWMEEHAPESLNYYSSDYLIEIRQRIVSDNPSKRFDLSFMRLAILSEVMSLSGMDAKEAKQNAQNAFAVFFEARNEVSFFPGALEMLSKIKGHYLIYALTNGNADIKKTGLDTYMDGAINAAEVSASKPSPEMFHLVLRKTKLKPENAVHIGDNLVDDIEGAYNAGFYSIWVNLKSETMSKKGAQPNQIVTSLSEIPTLLEPSAKAF
jgi:putative hydrolase of the HAD superfamily